MPLDSKESLVERWILHKLNAAAGEVNRQLEVRNFMAATNVLYNFWLYELCDVYIVRPLFLLPFTMSLSCHTITGSYEAYDG